MAAIDQETRRWGWMAVALGASALLTAAICAWAGVWLVCALFVAIGLALLEIGWLRLRGRLS